MKMILFDIKELNEIQDKFIEFLESIATKRSKKGAITRLKFPEFDYKEVSIVEFNRRLSEIGLTRREWVNLHMFGNKDITPLCHYCKINPLKFGSWKYIVTNCGSEDCKRKSMSERYNDPEYMSRWMKSREDKMLNNKLYHEKLSEGHKRQYENSLGTDKNLNSDRNKKRMAENGIYKKAGICIRMAYENNPELRVKQSVSHKKLWEDDDYFELMMRNRSHGRGVKSKIYSEYEGREMHLDSSWERSYFIFMSKRNDIFSIKRVHKRLIKYFNSEKNKICRYRPDFLVEYKDGHSEMIEIKPKYKLEHKDVIEKKEAAEKFCSENGLTYKILTEIELIELGVLDERCHPLYE